MAAAVNIVVTATDRATSVLKGIQTGIGAIGLAAGAALGSAIATTTEFANTVDDLNDRLGIGAEQTSAWVAAFELGETGIEAGTKALTAFSKEVEGGGKDLATLGVSVKTATGQTKPFKDLMLETAQVFSEMPDGLDKSALSMKIFGKAGQDMIPFLNRGADGIEDLLGEADKLGLTLSGDLLAANDEMAIGLKRLELGFKGVQTLIGSAVIPVIAELVTHLNDAMNNVIAFIRPFSGMIAPVLAAVAAIGALVGGGAALTAILAPLAGVIASVGSVIAPIIAPLIAITAAVAALGLAWSTNFLGIRTVTEQVFGAVLNALDRARLGWLNIIDALDKSPLAFDPVRQALTVLGNLLKGDFANAWLGVQNTIQAVQTTLSFLQPAVEMLTKHFQILGQILAAVVSGDLAAAMTGFGDLLKNLVTGWSKILPAIAAEVAKWAPVVIGKLGDLVTDVLAWIVEEAPKLGDQFEFWGIVAYLWVDNALRELMPKLANFLTEVTNWINAQLPDLEKNIETWVGPFVNWVLKVLAPLVRELDLMVLELLRWVITQLPTIEKVLMEWAAEFVKWVAPVIPPLLAALGSLLLELTAWAAGAAFNAMVEIGKGLARGIAQGVRDAANEIFEAVKDVVRRLVITVPVGSSVVTIFDGAKIPGLADGGYVPARSGGTLALLGEGGQGEYVIPENRLTSLPSGGAGLNVTINITGPMSQNSARELAEQVRDQFIRMGVNVPALGF